ncbi:MAG: hypothetical protein ABSC30_10625 [Acidimicrobiales bacterium]|jgi:hypothetical protein
MTVLRRGGLRRLVAIGLVALGPLWLAGCTAARDTLGTNSSPCFRALALAEDAVHDRGKFAGVRLVSDSTLDKGSHFENVLKQRSSTPLHNLCLVAYRGSYRPSQVKRPAGKEPASGVGHFAIVVVSTPQNDLLATFVLEKEPVRFRHLALGARLGTVPGPGASAVG